MRAVAAFACLLAVGVLLTISRAEAQATGEISVTATVADARNRFGTTTTVLRLWNRSLTSVPIGHVFVVCHRLGAGGVLGGGVSQCQATFQFPLGKLTASGIRHSLRHYTLVVTGGTRRYIGATGSVTRFPAAGGEVRFIFHLS